jgi:hypothetical protein
MGNTGQVIVEKEKLEREEGQTERNEKEKIEDPGIDKRIKDQPTNKNNERKILEGEKMRKQKK